MERITYQVTIIANAGRLKIKSKSTAVAKKNKQNLFSFQFIVLNLKENIGMPETKRLEETNTRNRIKRKKGRRVFVITL